MFIWPSYILNHVVPLTLQVKEAQVLEVSIEPQILKPT